MMVLGNFQNYSLMPALMLACAISTLVSRGLHANSVYTEPIRLRSLEMESSRLGTATEQTIGDMMRAPVVPVRETATLPEIAGDDSSPRSNNFLPSGRCELSIAAGVVALQDVQQRTSLEQGRNLTAVDRVGFDAPNPAMFKA